MNTQRLSVRKFRVGDLKNLYELLSDPQVMRWIEPPYTLEQTESFLNEIALKEPPVLYAVEDKAGSFIGYIIFHPYDADSWEAGWLLKKQFWNQGYAKELLDAMIHAALAFHQIKYLVLECHPNQDVTKHIALSAGFEFTGNENGCVVYQLKLSQ